MGNAQSSGDTTSVLTESTYPSVKTKKRAPPPNPYSFFDNQYAVPSPGPNSPRKPSTTQSSSRSQHSSSKSNKETVNFFEVAAVTTEPTAPKKSNSNPSTPASSIKKSYIHSASHIPQLTPTASRSSIATHSSNRSQSNSVTIDGRAYLRDHTTKSFMLPCDDDEADRLMTLVSEIILIRLRTHVD